MPFFAKPTKPFIDPTRGDAEAEAIRRAATAGDWQPLASALSSSSDRSRREFLVDAVVQKRDDLRWVDRWVGEQPASATARAVWGASAVDYSWKVRTAAEPQHVSAERFKGFFDWLHNAEEQLTHAVAMDPSDSVPLVARLWSAVGLGLPLEEATARWESLVALNPRTELGAIAYVTYISPRWNGTSELMWQFLGGLLRDEQDGSPRWGLVPDAHFEQWVADRMHGNARVHSSRYFQQPEVQQSIRDAFARYLGSASRQRSPLEPQYRGLFAAAFYLMGDGAALKRELETLGAGIQTIPWGYLGSTLAAYQNVRESVGLK